MRVGGLENAGRLWLGLGDGCKKAGWCGLVTMASTMAGPSGCLAAIPFDVLVTRCEGYLGVCFTNH